MARQRVLGVLAGEDMPLEQLRRWVRSAEVVLAADGGADRLYKIGVIPDATIGDLDSITDEARGAQTNLHQEADQNTSDCDKLLALVTRMGFGRITLASIEGDLLDHVIGNLSSCIASSLSIQIALRNGIGWILRSDCSVAIHCEVGARVSVLPLSDCQGVTISGVEWPIVDWSLKLGGKTSLSNRAISPTVKIEQQSGASLLIVGYSEASMPLWDAEVTE